MRIKQRAYKMAHLDNKNIVQKTMDDLAARWGAWCRLCGKEDSENNVNIHFTHNQQPLKSGEDVKLSLKEALEKYFSVQSSCEDLLPKQLCSDCYSLISSIMAFNVRVERVQQMYRFLLEIPMYDPCDLKSVRIKFDVSDDNKGQWCYYQNKSGKTCTENIQNATEDCGAEEFKIHFKEESCDIESNFSEYDESNDLDDETIDQEEVLYDEYIENDSQEDEEDPFETMSEDSVWGEEKMDLKNTTIKRMSTRKEQQNNANTVGIYKHKIRDTDLVNISCEKKKKYNDFVLEDVNGEKNQNASEDFTLDDINCEKKKITTEDFVLDVACKECGQKFDLYSTYCEHMEMAHGNVTSDSYCLICDRDLHTWYHLGRHMRVHMTLEARYPIKCPECESRYTTIAQLDVHINHKHRRTKPFICEVCGFRGGTQHSLKQHMYMHTDNAPFECEVCKKRFKKKSRLNFHMDIHGPNKFVCSICGLQLNSRATLKNHLAVHSDEMRHKCDYCGRAFKRSKYLKSHLLLHTGLKPYSCNFCNLTYTNRTNCRGHMRKVHPEELALWDASGNKAYTKDVPKLETLREVCRSAGVNKVRSVPLNGTIICDFCDTRFSYRGSCRLHMKKKHPKEFAVMEASEKKKDKPKFKKKLIEWFDFGKSEVCDFCDHTYANRRYCQAHIRRMHLDEMASMGASGTRTKNVSKLEIQNAVTNVVESVENSKSPLDLTPSTAPMTTATNIQDYFLLID